jgi:acetyl esterase/lipase
MAVRWLRAHADAYALDPARIGVWGLSAGGHLAALVGLCGDRDTPEDEPGQGVFSAQVQAVASIAAPTDIMHLNGEFEQLLLGGSVAERAELARLASPVAFVTPTAPPFLIIHGTQDERVPFQQALLLNDMLHAVGVDVTLMPIAEGNHMHLFQQHQQVITQAMLRFFISHLCS